MNISKIVNKYLELNAINKRHINKIDVNILLTRFDI